MTGSTACTVYISSQLSLLNPYSRALSINYTLIGGGGGGGNSGMSGTRGDSSNGRLGAIVLFNRIAQAGLGGIGGNASNAGLVILNYESPTSDCLIVQLPS